MLIVRHCVEPSRIHGLGLFLKEPVAAGEVIWRYDSMFDVEMPAAFVASLSPEDANIVYHHAEYFPDREVFRLGNDADIFMNHSDKPTLVDCGDEMIALRDLRVGDELTCDYREVHVVGYAIETAFMFAAE
jgi:SET domain-containing protein